MLSIRYIRGVLDLDLDLDLDLGIDFDLGLATVLDLDLGLLCVEASIIYYIYIIIYNNH
jgi:hypothetical protein